MARTHRCSVSCIAPPHLLRRLVESDRKRLREVALNTLLTSNFQRGERSVRSMSAVLAAPDTGRRTIYDCGHRETLTASQLVRTEDAPPASDQTANRAFEGLGVTREFYKRVFDRNSIDDRGMRLNGYVHYGDAYQNAFWDGQEMVFGDGDGEVFTDFTLSLDVIGHELTHGVVEYTANLEYHEQPGALNESIADVFGSLIKQWKGAPNGKPQAAAEADWLIGAELFTPGIDADALRSMREPGTAYDNALLGKDPQPNHMSRYVALPDTRSGDYGGVHINSGIPNKAFYLTAIRIGGFAWEAPGHIWYESLKASTSTTQFQEFADTTYSKAGQLYGTGSAQQQAVQAAWEDVGIHISAVSATRPSPRRSDGASDDDSLAELTRQIEALSAQLNVVKKDVSMLKARK